MESIITVKSHSKRDRREFIEALAKVPGSSWLGYFQEQELIPSGGRKKMARKRTRKGRSNKSGCRQRKGRTAKLSMKVVAKSATRRTLQYYNRLRFIYYAHIHDEESEDYDDCESHDEPGVLQMVGSSSRIRETIIHTLNVHKDRPKGSILRIEKLETGRLDTMFQLPVEPPVDEEPEVNDSCGGGWDGEELDDEELAAINEARSEEVEYNEIWRSYDERKRLRSEVNSAIEDLEGQISSLPIRTVIEIIFLGSGRIRTDITVPDDL